MQYYQTPEGKDPKLWQLAQRRASFKTHFAIYAIMSLFFWLLWYFTDGPQYNRELPWPVWPMLGWGIGVGFHYIGAYVAPRSNATEREYQKLRNNNKSETF